MINYLLHYLLIKLLKKIILKISIFLVYILGSTTLSSSPLTVHPDNPRYFANAKNEIVYLTGSHTWSFIKPGSFNEFSKMLERHGHNFIRYWMSEHTKGNAYTEEGDTVSIMPWQRTGPGNANDGLLKFDLNKFNQLHFDILSSRVKIAKYRNQYISIMLFQGWSIDTSFGNHINVFKYHPFNKYNNINELNADYFNHNDEGEEFHSVLDNTILEFQKAYIRKIVDTVNDFDNVLYEICNEDPGMDKFWAEKHKQWQYALLDYLNQYQATKTKQHPVGLTSHKSLGNKFVFESNADWVSPIQNKNNGENYKKDPPLASGKKVIVSDTDHLWGIGGDRIWIWKSFLRGLNPIYMDPLGDQWKKWNLIDARKNMGYTSEYSKKIDLVNMVPSSNLEHCSTGYCLRNPGVEYLIYQPNSGAFHAQIDSGTYQYEWFNPASGKVVETGIANLQDNMQFTAPFNSDAVLYLHIKKK